MAYQPFLIGPFQTGLDTDLETWMLPVDAFEDIRNGHIHHGVTEKREGFSIFAEMVESSEDNNITTATATNPVVLTLVNNNLANGTRIQVNYVDLMTQINGGEFLVSSTVPGAGGTITLQDLQGVDIDGTTFTPGTTTGQVSIFPGDRIMGLNRYIDFVNAKILLAFNTTRAAAYNSINDTFEPLRQITDLIPTPGTYTDMFSGSNTDYIWTANWASVASTNAAPLFRMYITNGKVYSAAPEVDGIYFYSTDSADALTLFRPQINEPAGEFINGCKLIFAYRQRLVLLHTFEGPNEYPQRARWCQSQDPDATKGWDDATPGRGGFVDAPTGEHIISARFLQDILVVFFTNSVWTLRPTADPALPFRWDKVNDFRACASRMSSIQYDRYVLALGQRGITSTDGVQTQRVDERIEDFTTESIDSEDFDKVFGLRSFANRRTWILYPGTKELEPDQDNEADLALILDDKSGSFSKYEIDLNVLGYGGVEEDLTLADFPDSELDNPDGLPVQLDDAADLTLRSWFFQDDADIFLGGTIDGKVLTLEDGGDDSGESIRFKLVSSSWNPFKDKGVECQFGYIDFYVETHPDTRATVSFFKNDDATPYAERTIDFLPNLRECATITDARVNDDPTTGFTITAPQHGLKTNDIRYIYGIEGAEYFNGGPYTVTVTNPNVFTVAEDMTSSGMQLVSPGTTQTDPISATVTSNNFLNGDEIYFVDVGGMVELNFTGDNFYTTAEGTNVKFELANIDGTGFTAWTADGYAFKRYSNQGVVTELPFIQTRTMKRAYGGGTGYSHKIEVTSEGIDRPVRIIAYIPYFRPRGRRMVN